MSRFSLEEQDIINAFEADLLIIAFLLALEIVLNELLAFTKTEPVLYSEASAETVNELDAETIILLDRDSACGQK